MAMIGRLLTLISVRPSADLGKELQTLPEPFRVSHGMLDISMSEKILNQSGISTSIS
jgi:hypothetical protein